MVAVNLLDQGLTSIDPAHNQAVPALATKWCPTRRSRPARRRHRTTGRRARPCGRPGGRHLDLHLDPHARVLRRLDGHAGRRRGLADGGGRARATARWPGPGWTWSRATPTWWRARPTTLSGLRAGDGTVRDHHHRARRRAAAAAGLARLRGVEAGPRAGARRPRRAPTAAGVDHAALAAPQRLGSVQGGLRRRHHVAAGAQRRLRWPSSTRSTSSGSRHASAALAAVHDGKADWAGCRRPRRRRPPAERSATRVQVAAGRRGVLRDEPGQPDLRQPAVPAGHHHGGRTATRWWPGVLPGLTPSAGVVPAGVPGAVADPCGANCAYRPGGGQGSCWPRPSPAGRIPIVEIDTDDDPSDVALANTVGFELAQVGIPMQVVPQPFATYQRSSPPASSSCSAPVGSGCGRRPGRTCRRCSGRPRSTTRRPSARPRWTRGWRRGQATANESQRQCCTSRSSARSWPTTPCVPLASYTQVLALLEPGARLLAPARRHLRREPGRGQGPTGTTGTTAGSEPRAAVPVWR